MNSTLENTSNLDLVLDVPVSLTIELNVNGKLIARGEVVVIEDRYGVKITEVVGSVPVA